MGSSSSKPQSRPYPLLTPGFNIPYGQNPNQYLPPHLQSHDSSPNRQKSKSKRKGSSDQEKLALAYVQGWHAGQTGMGPQPPLQPIAQRQPLAENTRPVNPPPPVRATPLFTPRTGAQITSFASPQVPRTTATTQRTQTPFTGSTLGTQQQQQQPQVPQQQEPQVQQQFMQPQATVQERANPDIARVLQPLPPPNPAVYGPPPLQQPLPRLNNPLPTPPRDLYELSPYNTLLNLPQTTALLTAAYTQQGGLPQSYGRRRGNRSGGLLRALTGRGRKEEDVHFVPVFINGQPSTNSVPQQQPGAGAGTGAPPPVATGPAAGPRPPVVLQDTPQFPTQQAGGGGASEVGASDRGRRRGSVARDTREAGADNAWTQRSGNEQPSSSLAPLRFSSSFFPGFLNYSPHRIVYNDIEYPSAMHLHEAMKYLPDHPELAERIRHCSDVYSLLPLSEQLASEAPNAVRSDWASVHLDCMEEAILNKFRQHPDLRAMLLGTGDAPLIYAEGDPFWGEGPPGQGGQNHLGLILARVRAELRREGGLI
ncbi:hypothetical protein B0H11DRAFT_1267163 [Mycena galericulata]|nr:hypothetical protein B0H11DRAFT_1267163 [Mycena galericulata]